MKSAIVFFLASLAGTTAASASSQCTDSVWNQTIAFYSSGPITFGSNFTDFTACASKCETLDTCESWLFSAGGGRCDLFANSPVATTHNPNFVYGGCKNKITSSLISPASSSSIPLRGSASPPQVSRSLSLSGAILSF